MADLTLANMAKLEKAYSKLFRFGQNVLTLRELIDRYPPSCKRTSVQEHTRKKVHLCYEKLAQPVYRYHVIIDDGWYEVGKAVYDDLVNVPEGEVISEG